MKIDGNNYWTLLSTDLIATDNIFTGIIIHTKVFSVKAMSVIIMCNKVARRAMLTFLILLHY